MQTQLFLKCFATYVAFNMSTYIQTTNLEIKTFQNRPFFLLEDPSIVPGQAQNLAKGQNKMVEQDSGTEIEKKGKKIR